MHCSTFRHLQRQLPLVLEAQREGLAGFTMLTQTSTRSTERQAAHGAETDPQSRADGDEQWPSLWSWAGKEAALRAQHHAAHRHSVPSRALLALLLDLFFGSRFLNNFYFASTESQPAPGELLPTYVPRCISARQPCHGGDAGNAYCFTCLQTAPSDLPSLSVP